MCCKLFGPQWAKRDPLSVAGSVAWAALPMLQLVLPGPPLQHSTACEEALAKLSLTLCKISMLVLRGGRGIRHQQVIWQAKLPLQPVSEGRLHSQGFHAQAPGGRVVDALHAAA